MVLAELTMFPTDKGESVSDYVSKVLNTIDKSGLAYQLNPMGTVLEGNWDEVFKVITDCFKTLEPLSNRINVNIKVDYRKGGESRLKSKMQKVEQLLGRTISHA